MKWCNTFGWILGIGNFVLCMWGFMVLLEYLLEEYPYEVSMFMPLYFLVWIVILFATRAGWAKLLGVFCGHKTGK